jgi:hypothetical protein
LDRNRVAGIENTPQTTRAPDIEPFYYKEAKVSEVPIPKRECSLKGLSGSTPSMNIPVWSLGGSILRFFVVKNGLISEAFRSASVWIDGVREFRLSPNGTSDLQTGKW